MAKNLRNPRSSKNLVLSLFALNPDKTFTTDEIHELALDNEFTKSGYMDSEAQNRIRTLVRQLRAEGFTVDSMRTKVGERARYGLRGKGFTPTFSKPKKALRGQVV